MVSCWGLGGKAEGSACLRLGAASGPFGIDAPAGVELLYDIGTRPLLSGVCFPCGHPDMSWCVCGEYVSKWRWDIQGGYPVALSFKNGVGGQ